MTCPHCSVAIHAEWEEVSLDLPADEFSKWVCRTAVCPACREPIIRVVQLTWIPHPEGYAKGKEFQAFPRTSNRAPLDEAVPELFSADYTEACEVLAISPKASAALSRRVLQGILDDQGYKSRNLAQQIKSVLADDDTRRVLPDHIKETMDAVRHFGNFAAHPITELTSLQVIDVEPEEAEWCLEIIEALFDHYYVTPVRARERLEQLNQKLDQAGKKPAKS